MIIGSCEVMNCGYHAPESPILVFAFVGVTADTGNSRWTDTASGPECRYRR
jgi:hypothetical protein